MTCRDRHGLSGIAMTVLGVFGGLLCGIAVWAVYTTQQGEIVQARLAVEIASMRASLDDIRGATTGIVLRRDFDVERARQQRIDDRQTLRIDQMQSDVARLRADMREDRK